MFHKGLSYDELMGMDVQAFDGFMERIKESTTKTSKLTEAQQDMMKKVWKE